MAKKVSDDAAKPNHFDPKRVETLILKIETEHQGLVAEKSGYMGRCRPYRERIAAAYEEGLGFEIPKAVLKAKIKERALQRKLDCVADEFEDDARDTFDQITQALGSLAGTPLGQAALNEAAVKPGRRAPAPKPMADDDKDLRPNFLRNGDAEAAADNAAALKAGIRPLPN